MSEQENSERFSRELDGLLSGSLRQAPDAEDADLIETARRLQEIGDLSPRSRGRAALRARLLASHPAHSSRRTVPMPRFNQLARAASFGALIVLAVFGLNWLLGNSSQVPDLAASLTATPTAGPIAPGDSTPDGSAEPDFAPFPGPLAFEWVQGENPGFHYANVLSAGQPLGRIDFGSLQGGWCDRSADGGVLAFVHENIHALGSAGTASEPAALHWIDLPDLTQVHAPLPDMQVMNPPSFGPAGFRLAFSACPSDGNCGLYLYDLQTGELKRISPHQPVRPVLWSPDGAQIAFTVLAGDLEELHIISAETGQTVFIAEAGGPEGLTAWGRPLPEGVNGVERCEAAPGAGAPEPLSLDMDSDSEEIRLRILFSHTYWQSLWVDARLDDQVGALTSSQRVQVWVDQPARARVLSGPLDGAPALLWISDGEQTRTGDKVRVEEYIPSPLQTDVITPHPMSSLLPTPLGSLLFPGGLAQRGGTYRPAAVETIAGREALVVDWIAPWGDVVDRFWVDALTGVILRQQNHGKDGGGALTSDYQVTAITFEYAIHPETFNRLAAFPPGFASGPEDIYTAAPAPIPEGTPETSLEYGEVYLQLDASSGFGTAGLVRFPAACLVTGALCPAPEPVAGAPEGFVPGPAAWSPDGTQLAYPVSGMEDEVWMFVRPLNSWIMLDVPYVSGLVWSPDSDWLAGQPIVYGDQEASPIVIVRQDGFGWEELLGDQPGYKTPVGWVDWQHILFVNTLDNEVSEEDPFVYSEISLLNTETGQVEVLAGVRSDANTSQFSVPVLSPDRSKFLYQVSSWQLGSTQVTIYDLAARSETAFTLDQPGALSWAPSGDRLLVTTSLGYTCTLGLLEPDGTGYTELYNGDWGGGCQAVWSPDGAYLLVPESAQDPTVPRLTILAVETGEARTVSLPAVGVPFEWPRASWVP